MIDQLNKELAFIEEHGLTRSLRTFTTGNETEVIVDGKKLLLFASNNYLGLATDPRMKKRAMEGISQYGTGSGGARLTTGNAVIHEKLEQEIAELKGTGSAIVFSSGYLANIGVLSSVMTAEDVIFSDAWNHASIIDGCRLSKAETIRYEHADMRDLEMKLRTWNGNGKKLIVTDGVFSMDGDIAPLPEITALAHTYDAYIMVDDAHATGTLGRKGGGTVEYFGLHGKVDFTVGTLSKAAGAEGGFVAASELAVQYMRNKARTFIFQTALSPGVIEAAREGIRLIVQEPERREQLQENARFMRLQLTAAGFLIGQGKDTAIISLLIGEAETAVQLSSRLLEEGLFIPAIRPPTVPQGSSRLRITVMATHTQAQLQQAVDKICSVGRKMHII